MHNSFDIEKVNNVFIVKSHNFPEIKASGSTEQLALKDMDHKIRSYSLNNPKHFLKRVKERLEAGLTCGCGYKEDSPVLAIVGL